MNWIRYNKTTKFMLSFLALGIMAFGVLSIVAMNHEQGMAGSCPVIVSQSSDCSTAAQAGVCIAYHLGIMHNLSQAFIANFNLRLAIIMLGCLLAAFTLLSLSDIQRFYNFLKIRLRQLYEKTVFAFNRQLGSWLVLFEKRDPSYAFALV